MFKELCSSPSKLAAVFRKGRAAWKARAQKQQKKAKALEGKVRDLTLSRDGWKAEARKFKELLREAERGASQPIAAELTAQNLTAQTMSAMRGLGGHAVAPPFCIGRDDKASRSV